MSNKRKATIRTLRTSGFKKKRIIELIRQIETERGESSARKVFQVLEKWRQWGWIVYCEENKKWGYGDYILHQDGFFINREGEKVIFQIVSSVINAKEHLAKHPDIPVIVVDAGITVEDLSEKMRVLFSR